MNDARVLRILKAPVISEKSTQLAGQQRQVVFKVDPAATKQAVKEAVEIAFNVEVESVRVLNMDGKKKRVGRMMGRRANWKKAYVKLKPGFDIELAG